MKMTLEDAAVLEAAHRAIGKSGSGKNFDADTFNAVAEFQLDKLRKEIRSRDSVGS